MHEAASRPGSRLAALTGRVEAASFLDRPAESLRARLEPLLRRANGRDLLSGTDLGHPAHPLLVQLPLGCWASAAVLDRLPGGRRSARTLIGLGVLAALPAVATGLSDWADTDQAERRVGLVHATANATATACFALSWRRRARGARRGRVLALLGLGAASAGGWLGGHLAYSLGVGVDTNAFEVGPDEWTRATGEPPTGDGPTRVDARGVGVAVATLGGDLVGLADRCSHRGGPLSQGTRHGDCLVCPWHGSAFDLRTGLVARGPASIPQPVYEARLVDGGVDVRRTEERSLRQRAVRPTRES